MPIRFPHKTCLYTTSALPIKLQKPTRCSNRTLELLVNLFPLPLFFIYIYFYIAFPFRTLASWSLELLIFHIVFCCPSWWQFCNGMWCVVLEHWWNWSLSCCRVLDDLRIFMFDVFPSNNAIRQCMIWNWFEEHFLIPDIPLDPILARFLPH